MDSKIVYIQGIGEIEIVKSKRVKNISIRIKPFEGVKVTVPVYIDLNEGEKFLSQKINWIKENLKSIEKVEENFTIFDENSNFTTLHHVLIVKPSTSNELKAKVQKGKILIQYPDQLNIRDNKVQEVIRKGIELAYRIEAKHYLPERVDFYSKKFGFQYKKVSIKNSKTRWGSCSYDNKINLSLYLMRLPVILIDYVIIHELCHTIEKNHGKGFWALLEKITGNARKYAKDLSNYRIKYF